jgi:hypothetical protein
MTLDPNRWQAVLVANAKREPGARLTTPRDSGSGPPGRRREPAPGEAPQSGLSDSEGIAQPEVHP